MNSHAPVTFPATPRPAGAAANPIRRYEILFLSDTGEIEDIHRVAPAIPAFEATSGAFAHGTLIDTDQGPIAVEDLLPGMMLQTRDNGYQPVLWIGSMTLVPQSPDSPVAGARMTRFTDSSMGLGRPSRDVVFGPYARVLRRNAACLPLFGTETAFAPAAALTDGATVIEVTPVSPVRVFHLSLHGQQILSTSGIEVESYHPGRRESLDLTPGLLAIFMGLFPHTDTSGDFGPMRTPRLTAAELRTMDAV